MATKKTAKMVTIPYDMLIKMQTEFSKSVKLAREQQKFIVEQQKQIKEAKKLVLSALSQVKVLVKKIDKAKKKQ